MSRISDAALRRVSVQIFAPNLARSSAGFSLLSFCFRSSCMTRDEERAVGGAMDALGGGPSTQDLVSF